MAVVVTVGVTGTIVGTTAFQSRWRCWLRSVLGLRSASPSSLRSAFGSRSSLRWPSARPSESGDALAVCDAVEVYAAVAVAVLVTVGVWLPWRFAHLQLRLRSHFWSGRSRRPSGGRRSGRGRAWSRGCGRSSRGRRGGGRSGSRSGRRCRGWRRNDDACGHRAAGLRGHDRRRATRDSRTRHRKVGRRGSPGRRRGRSPNAKLKPSCDVRRHGIEALDYGLRFRDGRRDEALRTIQIDLQFVVARRCQRGALRG